MLQEKKSAKRTALRVLVCLLGIVLVVILVFVGILFWPHRVVGWYSGESNFIYNDQNYSSQHFEYIADAYLGRADWDQNVKWQFDNFFSTSSVVSVKGDPNHKFLYSYNGDNGSTYVLDDVDIPKSGEVTAVYCRGASLYRDGAGATSEPEAIALFQRIVVVEGELIAFETENLASCQSEFYFAYNDCPVAAHQPGFITFVDGKFLFVKTGDAVKHETPGYNDQSGSGVGIEITDPELLAFIKSNPIYILPASYG